MQKNTSELPELLSERDRTAFGIARTMWYELLNRDDMPIVQIGGRKFIHRDLFRKWLEEQATRKGA